MRGIGMTLIAWGMLGIFFGCLMFGDIGIACIVGAVGSLLSGCGLLSAHRQIQRLWLKTGIPAEKQNLQQ